MGNVEGRRPLLTQNNCGKREGTMAFFKFFCSICSDLRHATVEALDSEKKGSFLLDLCAQLPFFSFPPFFGRARTKKSGTANWPCRRGKGKRETFLVLSSLLRARSPLLSPTLLQALREKKTLLYFATPSTSTLFYLLQVKRVPFLSNSHSWFEEERKRKRWGRRRKKVP